MRTIAAALLIALTVSACREATEQNPTADEVAPANETGPADAAPAATAADNQPTSIPGALHGRWGLVPADCRSAPGEAKGLVMINADEVRFYESVARPLKIAERTERLIRGEFEFSGEGMQWTNHMSWSVAGDSLTRVDSEEDSRLVYTRC